jgi:lipid II:glycine glycyltransferase (peptidoglycan interpeptide bridge formation enzyme)
MTLTVRAISADQHRAWISSRPSVSFLQLPEWGKVKAGWRPQSIGWFQGSTLVGAGLVLYRPIPKIKSRSLAYLPEGPDIDWLRERLTNVPLRHWLEPLVAHCKAEGAFQIKMGPPVAIRRWQADTVKDVMAHAGEPGVPARIGEIPADWHSSAAATAVDALRAHDWVQEESGGAGFGDVQPRYVFQIDLANRTLDDVFAGFNQLWRRNIRKAEKAGVEVTRGDYDDLAAFHEVYVETAQRDHFTPRSLAYFQRVWTELNGIDPDRLRLYIARHDGHVAAATLLVVVGTHSWYSYGASTTADRDVRPSNALQWRMISDAHAAGCSIYDLRGISDTLDPANHLYGLVQFKVGTGGFAQEYVGEWDRILRPAWARAFKAYQSRR